MEKKIFENAKSVKVRLGFEGQGCVNFDSVDQKWYNKGSKNNNQNFAKKEYRDGGFVYKVSSECARHHMYTDTMRFHNPNVIGNNIIKLSAISTPSLLERGYMFTSRNSSIKKSSFFTLTDAVEKREDGSVRPLNSANMEIHTRSGFKNCEEKGENDQKDTSLYYLENVGRLKYEAVGFIDLCEGQFISGDTTYDRLAVDVDGGYEETMYLNNLSNNLPGMKDVKFGYYYMKDSVMGGEWAERGVLLSKEAVSFMVKDILKRMFSISVYRRNGYLNTSSMEITVVYEENGVPSEKTLTIGSISDIEDLDFDYAQIYLEADEKKIQVTSPDQTRKKSAEEGSDNE